MGSIAKQSPRKKLRKSPHSSRPAGVVVDAQKLLWNQEGAILDTTELICSLMKEAGVTRSELAARMGKTKGNISQMLSGDRNLTIRTVSDLMTYLGDEYRASCKSRMKSQGGDGVLIQGVFQCLIPSQQASALGSMLVSAPSAIPEVIFTSPISTQMFSHDCQKIGA